jgi:flagellin
MRNIATGYRINSVRDDAAGMAISQKMRTQIRGLEQSSRNSLDGISLVQTAEGALQEVQNMLQRIRQLAVQSSNDTNTSEDRLQIDFEVQQLLKEIDAITQRTEFNKIKLINGSAARLGKVPVNDRTVVSMSYVSDAMGATNLTYTIDSFGLPAHVTLSTNLSILSMIDWSAYTGQILEINGEKIQVEAHDDTTSFMRKFQDLLFTTNLNRTILGNGVILPGGEEQFGDWDDFIEGRADLMLFTKDAGTEHNIRIAGDRELLEMFGISPAGFETRGSNASITNATISTGEMFGQSARGNRVELTGNAGRRVTLDLQVHGPDINGNFFVVDTIDNPDYPDPADPSVRPTITENRILNKTMFGDGSMRARLDGHLDENGAPIPDMAAPHRHDPQMIEILNFGTLKFQIGPNHNMYLDVQIPSISVRGMGLQDVNLRSLEWSQRSLRFVDDALMKINETRTRLGAYQNRLEHTIASIDVATENTSTSLSRLFDANIAWDMTQLSSLNVISQAGMAIMAQANQRPQQLLQLIR